MTSSEMRQAIAEDELRHPAHQYHQRCFGQNVLVVASVNTKVGDWAAYIGAVPGEDHSLEWIIVRNRGAKLPQVVAEGMFPNLKSFDWRA